MVAFKIDYPKTKNDWGKKYGLNAIYAGKHWTIRRRDSEYWHWLTLSCLNKQKIPKKIFNKPVSITFWWNDRLDIGNHAYMAKMIEDALRGYLIKDDSKKYVKEHVHKFHSEKYILIQVSEVKK